MPRLPKSDLLDAFLEGCRDAGWGALVVESRHPFRIRIYSDDESYSVRLYVWNLTHGGGAARPANEYRIQITGITTGTGFRALGADKVLVLGWWNDAEVFAGFDATRHAGPLGSSPSIQIREEALRLASVQGIATHDKGNGEIAVAFKPAMLPEYVGNLDRLHEFGDSDVDRSALDRVAEAPDRLETIETAAIAPERHTVLVTIARKLRDRSFKDRVLVAYGHACAFCGIQLKLVDAAHILPVAEQGTDQTANGVALCALHHRAYDRAMVTLNEEYQILVNQERLADLREWGLDGGEDRFQQDLRAVIHVPPDPRDRPHGESVRLANRLRGWTVPE